MDNEPMKTIVRIFGVPFVAVLLVTFYGCSGNRHVNFSDLLTGCEDTIKEEIKSPDRKWIITIYERNCGATASYATHINLHLSKVAFNGKTQEPIFVMGRRQKLQVNWDGNTSILVRYPKTFDPKEDVFRKDTRRDGINILYESVEAKQIPSG
jgi:hypothetical protein